MHSERVCFAARPERHTVRRAPSSKPSAATKALQRAVLTAHGATVSLEAVVAALARGGNPHVCVCTELSARVGAAAEHAEHPLAADSASLIDQVESRSSSVCSALYFCPNEWLFSVCCLAIGGTWPSACWPAKKANQALAPHQLRFTQR